MSTERRVITNRVFLLGFDDLYREAMKRHERDELLRAARETAKILSVAPADVPIEGYYSEDESLKEYFRLVRALQEVPRAREAEVADSGGYQRLKQVTESPIFGRPHRGESLLSVGMDALSVALKNTFPDWTVENLTQKAHEHAVQSNDFSLVALAALSKDSVVLAALRESVVLYSMVVGGAAVIRDPEYVWEVDPVIQERATRFVETFNDLLGEDLPAPVPENAGRFWQASKEWKIIGRCVRIGFDDSTRPIRHYHWAIESGDQYRLFVKDFWDTEIWTTARYREMARTQ